MLPSFCNKKQTVCPPNKILGLLSTAGVCAVIASSHARYISCTVMVHRDIDVQDLSDQESMMSLTLETKVEMKEMDTVTTKLEDIDLKSVDEYLDLCLMENTDSDIKI